MTMPRVSIAEKKNNKNKNRSVFGRRMANKCLIPTQHLLSCNRKPFF